MLLLLASCGFWPGNSKEFPSSFSYSRCDCNKDPHELGRRLPANPSWTETEPGGVGWNWGEKKKKESREARDHLGGWLVLPSPSQLHPSIPPLVLLDIAQVQIGLLYPPVGGDLFRLVAFHVLLHGRKTWAVLQADRALIWGGSVVGPEVLDHGRVVSGPLVAELALKGFLTCN